MRSPTSPGVRLRVRWSALGAAVAVSLGAGGFGLARAEIGTGERPVTVTVTPERVLDTRSGLGLSGRFVDATPRDLVVTGTVPVAPSGTKVVVPADAIAVLVNVTVVAPSSGGFLSLRPGGATGTPSTSTVNFQAGVNTPNSATVDLGPGGTIQIWLDTATGGDAHVLLDIVGYTVGHHHDDRYYTESEVDAAVADVARVAAITFLSEPFPIADAAFGSRGTPLCPSGELAVAGGMDAGFVGDPGVDAITYASYPNSTNGNRNWIIQYSNSTGSTLSATTYTVCAEVAP